MKRDLVKKVVRGFLEAAAIVLLSLVPPVSCGLTTPSPAAPPVPPAELPAALTFPQSVNVEFGTPTEEASLNLVRPLVPIGGEFLEAIQFGFDVNDRANAAVQGTLNALSVLEIPLNPITSTFELGPTGGLFGDGIKINFADFYFPGKTEACTGCTCPTGCDAACPTEAPEEDLRPVCYRIWRDDSFDGTNIFTPFMAGFMTQLPTRDDPETPEDETNPGNGFFRQLSEDDFVIEIGGADYRHRDTARPLDKRTDLFGVNINKPTGSSSGNAVINLVNTAQKALEGATSKDQLLKTLRHTASEEKTLGVVDPDHALRYLAQFREDADFWSGTLQNDFESTPGTIFVTPPEGDNFTDQCAQLSTAIGVEELTCEDLGINVTEVPFLEVKSSSDPSLNLPADFPAVPTF